MCVGGNKGGIAAEGMGVDLIKTHYITRGIIKQKCLMSLIFREMKITASVELSPYPRKKPFYQKTKCGIVYNSSFWKGEGEDRQVQGQPV